MREGTHVCLCWFMLLCGRNQCNIVKQVSSNKKEKNVLYPYNGILFGNKRKKMCVDS